jgi:Zn-dependent peptidase ImmA (M78 family)
VNVPDRPRYEYAKQIGRDFLKSIDIKSYPIDPIKIVYLMKWKFEIDDLCGEEGYTLYNARTKNYCIIIDNAQGIKRQRCKFTIAHEIGHIVMKHYTSFDTTSLTDNDFRILDLEADIVAGEILMPYTSIRKNFGKSILYLATKFDVSYSAMETRLRFLDLYNLYFEDDSSIISK